MRCHWNLATRTLMFLLIGVPVNSLSAQLIVTGAVDGPLPGGNPKAIELYVAADISDLSLYGVGSANNGKGSNGVEFTFPADSATAGEFLYVALEEIEFENFFAFPPDYTSSALSINGDDAIEVFREDTVIDVFGQIDLAGIGQPWEHTDGWAYRQDKTGPDGSTFVLDNWFFSGPDALDGEYMNDTALTPVPFGGYVGGASGAVSLRAGDADQDLEFDQFDLIQVQVANKYLSGLPATWGEGDWDGAPGGQPGNPPEGNGFFDQLDIVAALNAGMYLKGPYNALSAAINIDSAAGIFTGAPAQDLGGSFDNDTNWNIFKATFGSSFGSLSFGNVASAGLSGDFVANDLTVVGSLAGGGDLGLVDLIRVPEPTSAMLLGLGLTLLVATRITRRA